MKKRMTGLLRFACLLVAWVAGSAAVQAGSRADCTFGVQRYGDTAIREFALRLNDVLDAHKVNVAIVARAGRPRAQLPRGISYTHVAFIVFEPVRGADGKAFYTYTVYNLYQQGKGHETESYLRQDLTYDFVAGIVEPDVAVCVPIEPLQKRLLHVIRSATYRELYIPSYNLVANPWVDRYDNCATHLLKVCVAAIYQTNERARIDADIREYFHPTRIKLNLLEALGSNFIPDVRRDDEDPSGLQTATYDSVRDFLAENGLVKEMFVVHLGDGPAKAPQAR